MAWRALRRRRGASRELTRQSLLVRFVVCVSISSLARRRINLDVILLRAAGGKCARSGGSVFALCMNGDWLAWRALRRGV